MAEKKTSVKYKFGQKELDMDKYLKNVGHNVQSYLEDRRKHGWTDDLVQEFSTAYNRYMDAFKLSLADNDNRFSTDDLGNITDLRGEFSNIDNDGIDDNGSEYYYNDKGERITTSDYNALKDRKKKKYKTFNANRLVAEYLRTIGNAMGAAKPSEDEKFDLSKHGFVAWWNQKFNPAGGDVELKPFLDKDPVGADGKRPVSARAKMAAGWMNEYLDWLKDKNLDYSKYDQFSDYDTYAAKGKELAQKWDDDNWDADDLIAAQAFGISNDFSKGFFTTEEDPNLTPEQREAKAAEVKLKEELAKAEQLKKDKQAWIDQQISAFHNSNPVYTLENPFTSSFDPNYWYDSSGNLNEQNYYSAWGSNFIDPKTETLNINVLNQYMLDFVLNPFGAQYKNDIARNIVGLINQGIAQQIPSGKLQGMYYIPSKSDEGTNRALVFDPETKQLFYTFIGDIPSQWEIRRNKFDLEHGIVKPNETYMWKEGGVITTMQFGGNFGDSFLQSRNAYVKGKADAAGLTPEEYMARNRKAFGDKNALETNNGWNRYDTARLTATAGDIAAMIASLTPVPGATVVGASVGAASTTGHLLADLEDGFDAGDVGRAALGYGLDALSLIPGVGAVSKGAKIAKTVAKYAPKLIAAVGAAHAVTNAPEIISSIGKVSDPSKMTVQDWQNIAEAITLTTAGTAAGARHFKMKKSGAQTLIGKTKHDAQTYSNGVLQLRRKSDNSIENLVLTADEAKAVKGAKNNEEIMNALKHRGGMEDYEVVTSKSMRPRFQSIRKDGKWRSPIHFGDKKAEMLALKRDQFTGKSYAETKGLQPDIDHTKLTYKTKGQVEEGVIGADLAKVRRQSDAYAKLLAEKEAKTTKFTKQRDDAKAASEKYKTDNGLTKSVDELIQIQKDLKIADYHVWQEKRKLDTLTRRAAKPGAIKAETLSNLKKRLKAALDEVKRLKGEVSSNTKWQSLSQPKREAKLQEYIDNIQKMQRTLDATNKKLKTLEGISNEGHTQAYQELLGRKKADNTIDFNIDGRTVTRNFDDILSKYNILYLKGGILNRVKKFSLGNPITNVRGNADWFEDMYKHPSMTNWLATWNPKNYELFNLLQDSWAKNKQVTGYDPNDPQLARGEGDSQSAAVLSRQKQWNETGTNAAIEDAVNRKVLTRNGGTKDNQQGQYQDGYFGAQEFLRHGGTGDSWYGHDEELKAQKELFKKQGLDYYLDIDDNMYKLRPLNPGETPLDVENPQNPNTKSSITEVTGNGDKLEKEKQMTNNTIQQGLNDIGSTIPSIGHLLYLNDVNRRMAERSKSVKPTYYDPKNNYKYVRGDFDALMAGRQAAGNMMHLASQPLTSDGRVLTAGYLDAVSKALDYFRQGRAAWNQEFVKRQDELWKLIYDDDAFNYDVAMKNRATGHDKIENDINIDNALAAKESANWETLWQEGAIKRKQKENRREALQEKFAISDIHNAVAFDPNNYNAGLTDDELNVWNLVQYGDKKFSELDSNQQALYSKANRKVSLAEQDQLRGYYGIPHSTFGNVRDMASNGSSFRVSLPYGAKKGGVLQAKDGAAKIAVAKIRERTKDADRFEKNTKDRHDRVDKAIARIDKKMYRRRDPEKRRK